MIKLDRNNRKKMLKREPVNFDCISYGKEDLMELDKLEFVC